MNKFFLAIGIFNIVVMADFLRNDSGIVTDNITGLQWQDNYSDNDDEVKIATWEEAIGYCEDLNLGGNDDWRLPNINELNSIVDFENGYPAVDSSFSYTTIGYYWSSTTNAVVHNAAWYVNFGDGNYDFNDKSNSYSIRCVRSGL